MMFIVIKLCLKMISEAEGRILMTQVTEFILLKEKLCSITRNNNSLVKKIIEI